MHLYAITRGIKNDVDQFITELQGKYLPVTRKEKTEGGNIVGVPWQCQVAVRPIQLWEVVFPEEHKDLMINTLFTEVNNKATQHDKHEKWLWPLRKALGVDKVPETKDKIMLPISKKHFECVRVGIKEDVRNELGNEML